jgi:hypothetical protein
MDFSNISSLSYIQNFGSLFIYIYCFIFLLGVYNYIVHKRGRGLSTLTGEQYDEALEALLSVRRWDPFYYKLGGQYAINKTNGIKRSIHSRYWPTLMTYEFN